jgi:hypothetical protein
MKYQIYIKLLNKIFLDISMRNFSVFLYNLLLGFVIEMAI